MIRKMILTSLLLAVASAGAMTVKQLTTAPKLFAGCSGICSRTVPCPDPEKCLCVIADGDEFGVCLTRW